MRKTIITLISSLCLTGSLFSQNGMSAKPRLSRTGVNLSLWKGCATQRTDTAGTTWLNLGLFSAMRKVNGLGANLLGSTVTTHSQGVQLAGFFNLTGQSLDGLQAAGGANVNGHMNGISMAGLVGITRGRARGLLLSGLANVTGGSAEGVVFSGLLNLTGQASSGFFLSGLAGIAQEDFRGMAAGGLLNIAGRDLKGWQVAGLANITGGRMKGVQMAPFNVATTAKGVQIGLVNYYKERLDGFQLGLVNANPRTRVQLLLFGGNQTKLNMGARFKNELFYTILGGGTHYLDFDDRFSAAFFYRAGLELPLYRRLYISGDLGFQHIETFRNKRQGIPARLYALQARVNLEYRLTRLLGIFVTGGYGTTRRYTHGKTFDRGILAEGGGVLFRY